MFAVVTTVAGSGTSAFADGVGTAASFISNVGGGLYSCTGIFVTSVGNIMVMDYGGNRIRMIATSGMCSDASFIRYCLCQSSDAK